MNTMLLLVRREFWEHRSLWIAPLVWAGIIVVLSAWLFFYVIPQHVPDGVLQSPNIEAIEGISDRDREEIRQALEAAKAHDVPKATISISFLGISQLISAFTCIVVFFYLIDCLFTERRDRSILFWKSLPLSDTQVVLSKFAVALVVVVFGVVLALNVGGDPQADAKQSHLVGKAAPSFDLPNLAGGRIKLADIAGKATIVNFWNSWCTPCLEEEPRLKAFYEAHKYDPDFTMIGIVRRDETDDVRAHVKQNGIKWTVALDPGSVAALDFGTRGQPETYAITPTGIVAAAKYGAMEPGELEKFLRYARGQA